MTLNDSLSVRNRRSLSGTGKIQEGCFYEYTRFTFRRWSYLVAHSLQ